MKTLSKWPHPYCLSRKSVNPVSASFLYIEIEATPAAAAAAAAVVLILPKR
jgi:hypothetical protein